MSPLVVIASSLLLPACFYDVKERRIPNGLILAFLLIIPAWLIYSATLAALPTHLLAALIAFVTGFVFWMLGWLGAGDVKLIAVLAMLLGMPLLAPLLLNIALAGVALALLFLLFKGMLGRTLQRYRLSLTLSLSQRKLDYVQPDAQEQQVRLPYAVAIASGALLTIMGVSPL